ncbi:MAG: ABC transporter substrate-binding protein [Proteobacteria bacterium]|jgi:branched-chain amino acid transport system substrate-binding protein|nr:ABC transporter substrate-binding protein [Pseudomonadota bacterium]
MKRERFYCFVVVACIISLIAFTSTIPTAEAGLKGKSVKVGVIVPLAGPAISWGQHSLLGAEIARDEINDAGGIGGIPLELIVEDTASKSDQAISLARKLTEQDKVLIILGPILSSACEVVFPVINRMKIVAVSPTSAKPGLSAKYRPWAYRNNLTSDKTLGPALEKWVKDYNLKKVAIIYDSSDAVSTGEGAKVYPIFLKKFGAKIIESLTVQKKDIDFSAHITRIKAKNPDGVALAAQAEQAANIVREMQRQGLNIPVITGVECANPLFIRTGKSDVEGVWTASATWADNPNPKVKKFVTKFMKRKNGEKPNSGGFKSYDTIYIIKEIIEKYGVTNDSKDLAKDRDRLREGWKNVKNFPGVSGLTTINEVGDGVSMPAILCVSSGQWVAVK